MDVLAELGHDVVVDLELVRPGLDIDGDQATTGGTRPIPAREMRTLGVVCPEGPRQCALGPILERAYGEVGGLVPPGGCRGPAFRLVLIDSRVCVVEIGQDSPVVIQGIAVPRHSVVILVSLVQDGLGVAGHV